MAQTVKDIGQTIHRFTNWVILALVATVVYFLQKMDGRLDKYFDKTDVHETRITVIENDTKYFREQIVELKQSK